MKNPDLYRCDTCHALYTDFQEASNCVRNHEQCLPGAEVMMASPYGIRILRVRVRGEPTNRFHHPYFYSLIRCEFDDDSDQHTPVLVYETPLLAYSG